MPTLRRRRLRPGRRRPQTTPDSCLAERRHAVVALDAASASSRVQELDVTGQLRGTKRLCLGSAMGRAVDAAACATRIGADSGAGDSDRVAGGAELGGSGLDDWSEQGACRAGEIAVAAAARLPRLWPRGGRREPIRRSGREPRSEGRVGGRMGRRRAISYWRPSSRRPSRLPCSSRVWSTVASGPSSRRTRSQGLRHSSWRERFCQYR